MCKCANTYRVQIKSFYINSYINLHICIFAYLHIKTNKQSYAKNENQFQCKKAF